MSLIQAHNLGEYCVECWCHVLQVDALTAAVLAAAASITYIRQPYHQAAGGFVIMLHILRMVFLIVASSQM